MFHFVQVIKSIKVAQKAERDPKACLNMARKDQLCAIALMKRNLNILKVFLKMVAMVTSHTLLRS